MQNLSVQNFSKRHLSSKTCFSYKENLAKHVSTIHEKKKPFKCELCNKDFTQLAHMKGHVSSVHEGKKPFECNICNSTFSQKQHMRGHVKIVHEG